VVKRRHYSMHHNDDIGKALAAEEEEVHKAIVDIVWGRASSLKRREAEMQEDVGFVSHGESLKEEAKKGEDAAAECKRDKEENGKKKIDADEMENHDEQKKEKKQQQQSGVSDGEDCCNQLLEAHYSPLP
jgi:hypothetical protein